MKRLVWVALTALSAVTVAISAVADGTSRAVVPKPVASMHGGTAHGHPYVMHHGRKRLLVPQWKETLSEEQKLKIDNLRVSSMKANAPLKAAAQALEVELVLLAIAEEPHMSAVGKKIDELVAVKREIWRERYRTLIESRRVLNADQHVSFDLGVLHHAQRRAKRRH